MVHKNDRSQGRPCPQQQHHQLVPESIGKGRFGDWIENVQDWSISRNRYWGTPLNVWECEAVTDILIGSIEELKSMSSNCPDDIELHRPYIDAVTIKCPKCGGEMHRVPEVIDCWFDSGSMPFRAAPLSV